MTSPSPHTHREVPCMRTTLRSRDRRCGGLRPEAGYAVRAGGCQATYRINRRGTGASVAARQHGRHHALPSQRGHSWVICMRPPARSPHLSAAPNRHRYARRELMKRHEESHPQWRNSLPFVDPLPERHGPALKRQIRHTARWPPGEQGWAPERRSSCSVARNSAQDLGSVHRRPRGQGSTRTRVRHLRRSRLLYFAAVLSDSLFELCL